MSGIEESRPVGAAMLGSGTKTEYKLVGRPRGYYAAHRKEMDEGAVVAWPERYNVDELSAIQHAMNLKLRDELAFMAEYQQEPIAATASPEGSCQSGPIAWSPSSTCRPKRSGTKSPPLPTILRGLLSIMGPNPSSPLDAITSRSGT